MRRNEQHDASAATASRSASSMPGASAKTRRSPPAAGARDLRARSASAASSPTRPASAPGVSVQATGTSRGSIWMSSLRVMP